MMLLANMLFQSKSLKGGVTSQLKLLKGLGTSGNIWEHLTGLLYSQGPA